MKYSFGEFKIQSVRDCSQVERADGSKPSLLRDYWKNNIEGSPAWHDDKELLVVVLLDARLQIMGWHLVSLGGLNEAMAHPREIIRPVIVGGAYGFVLMHNHPSGDSSPSKSDGRITRNARDVGNLLKVELIDHVIIANGSDKFFSFREAGLV